MCQTAHQNPCMIQERTVRDVTRSSWNGMVEIGLLVFPAQLHRATDDEEYAFRQVHIADGGGIQYTRKCSVCGEEVAWEEIGKGKEAGDRMIVLDDDDLATLPVSEKVVKVEGFIDGSQVDLSGFGKAYNVVPDKAGLHAYTLLRQEIKASGKVGLAKFAMRGSKDSLAIIRAQGKMLVLQVISWPESIREPDFKFLREEVAVTGKERKLARQLIEAMVMPWKPEEHKSVFGEAVTKLVEAKLAGAPPVAQPSPAKQAAQADIGAVLEASIKAEKERRKVA